MRPRLRVEWSPSEVDGLFRGRWRRTEKKYAEMPTLLPVCDRQRAALFTRTPIPVQTGQANGTWEDRVSECGCSVLGVHVPGGRTARCCVRRAPAGGGRQRSWGRRSAREPVLLRDGRRPLLLAQRAQAAWRCSGVDRPEQQLYYYSEEIAPNGIVLGVFASRRSGCHYVPLEPSIRPRRS